ncbi:MAG: nucleotidyltransferase domain-containing protein [bacterium]
MKTIGELRNARLRKSLEAVKAEVRRIAGNGARLIIYGSYARGEEREDSDVDLMVVLPDEKRTFEIEDRVRDAIYDIGFDNDFVISVMVVTETQVAGNKGFMVFGSVEKDGVLI